MWLMLQSGMYSIVAIPDKPELLKVRARRPGDIETLFPHATIHRTPGRDYLFRAEIPRREVAEVLAQQVLSITASNFKASVTDPALHRAYADVWTRMARLQSPAPYSED